MRHIALTVDVDRDVNRACKGSAAAISSSRDGDEQPRFDSSADGLKALLSLMRAEGVRGTFFMEGRTAEVLAAKMDLPTLMAGQEVAAHGYDHEDFTGQDSGLPLDAEGTSSALDGCAKALDHIFGPGRRGFRAPYMRSTPFLKEELAKRAYLYESSEYMELREGRVRPYLDGNGVMQVPVAVGRDAQGKKIFGYLWPLHEGKRPVADYLALLDSFEDGLLVLATHSWHMVECFSNGKLDEEACARSTEDLRAIIEHAKSRGMEFTTIRGHLASRKGGC
jgi:peptidoglycan/xylan/chitin deacetylase (PgdA/CDA1 family)